jgi:hypothetical protein
MLVYDPRGKEVRTHSVAEIEGPCFVATITSLDTGETNRAALLRCAFTLYEYLLSVKGVEIKHIHMMSPPSISGRNSWVMEELISVTSHSGLETSEGSVVYRTTESVYKIGEFDMRKRKRSRLLYSAHHLLERESEPSLPRSNWEHPNLFGKTS